MSINQFILNGNLTRDPELRSTASGTPVVQFSIANNVHWTGADGQKHERANFFRIKDFGKSAENHAKYLKKGSEVTVIGRLEPTEYEKDGATVYGMDFIADQVQYHGGKKD